ncbi:hypothetical protein K470DRAFT_170317 [Piedraia hortae CBS 480.64]|uniref:Uncharacterized protein n=1 Tax=Piedraia hortae CBS 480.64 TaxID=1314780 RepID=A0A6A7BQJ9_9PEZI|nr:hypothetical protein K470DRAFT_170317 [Piedraia hortae CBS 480.64]
MKATSMLRGLMPDLVRPRRGVQAFDLGCGRPVLISGCVCRFMADNSAAAALCSIHWTGGQPCHDYYWRWTAVSQWKDIIDVSSLRVLRHTKGLPAKEADLVGIEHPLTELYRLKGFDPHQDFTYDMLHSLLLGVIIYPWLDTLNLPVIKEKLLEACNSCTFSRKGRLCDIPLTRQIANWNKSFTGGGFRNLL